MPASSSPADRLRRGRDHYHLPARVLVVAGLLLALAVLAAPRSSAGPAAQWSRQPGGPTATTVPTTGQDGAERLPGTTLEAEERDDGGTNAAPWIIGSGIAAGLAVAVGGTVLKRRAS